MSTKLKRTPLFGQDGHLGIPIIANNNKHKIQVIIILRTIKVQQWEIVKSMASVCYDDARVRFKWTQLTIEQFAGIQHPLHPSPT